MKKKEIIIITIILLIAAVFIMVENYFNNGSSVMVTVDGDVYGTYSLYKNQTIEIESDSGLNVLVIEDKKAFITYASCPDKICQKTYPISEESKGVIVCLPNKVVVELNNNY